MKKITKQVKSEVPVQLIMNIHNLEEQLQLLKDQIKELEKFKKNRDNSQNKKNA